MNKRTLRIIAKIKTIRPCRDPNYSPLEAMLCGIVEWIEENEFTTIQQAWNACECPDWMCWYVGAKDKKFSPRLRLAACVCVRIALKHLPNDERRPRKATKTAEYYARGEATKAELDADRKAAVAAIEDATAAFNAVQNTAFTALRAARATSIERGAGVAAAEATGYAGAEHAARAAAMVAGHARGDAEDAIHAATKAIALAAWTTAEAPAWVDAMDAGKTLCDAAVFAGKIGSGARDAAWIAAYKKMANIIRKEIPKP